VCDDGARDLERQPAAQTPDHLKTPTGEEAFNPDGLAQRSIALLKDTFADLEVRTQQ
jgi:hypothetical protein